MSITQLEAGGHRRLGPLRSELRALLELFGVAGIAITQPALDLLSKNVGLFVARRASSLEIVLLVLVVVLLPAGAAWLVELAIGAVFPRARRWVHALLVATFVAIATIESVKHGTDLGPTALVVAAVAGAIVAAVLVVRYSTVRTFLRYLALAQVGFIVLFFGAASVSGLMRGHRVASVSGVTIGNPKRVVMIVADELPLESLLDGSGHVDAGLYPNFAALAGTSTWYRNDTTVSPFTNWAVPALVTGQNPTLPFASATPSSYPDSIFRLLGGLYDMNVHETSLCPKAICPSNGGTAGALPDLVRDTRDLLWDFASPEPVHKPSFGDVEGSAGQLSAGRAFVRSIAPSVKPRFDYLHILLPHLPWRYLPSLQDAGYSRSDPFNPVLTWETDARASVGRERHILQLQALDVILGQAFAKLRAAGAWDDSLVVVTADHGEAFTGGEPLRSATSQTADQILWTPLFVKLPGQRRPFVDDRPMQSIDVVPTIADVIDAKVPWSMDGTSASGTPRPEFDRPLYQWTTGPFDAPGAPLAPGVSHLTFPAASNFRRVLASRAAPAGGSERLRPYRVGPYGSLIGQDVAPMVRRGAPETGRVSVPDPSVFEHVDPRAHRVPWTALEGFVSGLSQPRYLAFSVNGSVAGLAPISPMGSGRDIYGAALAPRFFRRGSNAVRAYAVSGSPDHPVLEPVAITS